MEYKRLTKKGGWYEDIDLKDEYGYKWIYQSLAEFEDKLENGTLIELPVAIGQMIYRKDAHFCWTITEAKIYEDEIIFYDDSDNMIKVEDIGKTVFLTKAEAEQKLRELKDETKM